MAARHSSKTQRGRKQNTQTHAWAFAHHAAAQTALALLATAAYTNALSNGFVWDDTTQILQNAALRPGAPWRPLLTSDVWAFAHPGSPAKDNYWRPLQMLSYKAIVQMFGFSALPFHALNLVFHVAATLLAYAIGIQLTRRIAPSVAVAVLFALHPMHTEAVDWISALPELGCAVFYFLAFLLFLLAIRRSGDNLSGQTAGLFRRPALWLLSCVSFAVATIWKEMAVTLPLAIAAYLFFVPTGALPLTHRVRNAVQGSLPYLAVLAVYLAARDFVLGYLAVSMRDWKLSPLDYAFTVADLVGRYWWKLLLPLRLNAYYVFDPVRSWAEPRALAAILFLVLATAGIVYSYRWLPLAAFAATWVFVTLIPVLDLRAVGRNVFTERYLYIPSLGFCLLAVSLASAARSRLPARWGPWPGGCALALVAGLYLAQTVRRNPIWKNQFTFFSRTLAASPNSPVLANQVASLLYPGRNDPKAAERLFRRAVSLAEARQPPEPAQVAKSDLGLALIASERGSHANALTLVAAAQRAWPGDPQIPQVRGAVLLQAGSWREAKTVFAAAARTSPGDANIWNALGFIAWRDEHRYAQARDYFRHALELRAPSQSLNASLQENLGAVDLGMGRRRHALDHLHAAVRIAPNNPDYHINLASALASSGQLAQARTELEQALALDSGNARAQAALARLGNPNL